MIQSKLLLYYNIFLMYINDFIHRSQTWTITYISFITFLSGSNKINTLKNDDINTGIANNKPCPSIINKPFIFDG